MPTKFLPWIAGIAAGIVALTVLLALGLGVLPKGTGGSEDSGEVPPSRLPLRYSGEGSRGLGDINVPEGAVIEWTNRPQFAGTGFFSVDDEAFSVDVSSTRPRGRKRLRPGIYRKLHVDAQGRWSMEIRRP